MGEKAAEAFYANVFKLISDKISDKIPLQEIKEQLEPLLKSVKLKPDNIPQFSEIIKQHNEQTLQRAKIQFWFSLVAATVGFFMAFYLASRSQGTSSFEQAIRFMPGFTLTLVAGLFFKQANQTNQQARAFFDQINLHDEKRKAIELVESINSEEKRDLAKARLAMIMVGINAKELDLKQLFPIAATEDQQEQK